MADQQFCLRWNNFQNNIISSFEYLRSEEDFVDVTLACEGKSLKAHKVILSACSTYFRDLLKTTPCSHPIIVLKDVSYDDLLSLMCFVYQGVVYIGQERLTQFLRTAEFLQIKGLSEHCIGEPFARQQPATQSSPSQSAPAAAPPSPQPRSGTPSPSPSFREAPRPSQSSAPPLAPLPPAKRRKPLYPLHTPAPSSTACVGELPGTSVSPSRPSQSSPTEGAQPNGTEVPTGLPPEGSSETTQEEALSLVSETSILRQRIEGGRAEIEQPVKVETNGPHSPALVEHAKLSPRPLIMDPNALSMVGRESLGFPFLSQPGTSSLLATTTTTLPTSIGQEDQQTPPAMSYDAQMLLRTSTGSPRFRQRWRCMQPSVCPHCLRTFSNAFNLKQHIINVHTFGNELKCEVCGKVQKNKWYLRKHMVKSHNAPLRRVKLPDGSMVNTE
ncbi:broad-complex core protein isoforms 1/2/3/4/5-like [Amphibalanus amphitrite]|uniref:broad-complex core protein isoforms 1/2/3/4/5-like n=1 Tax=Amphibalanus amphitrite TaxID=1232801 RepID=UPI001C91A1A2|nr:broad-complex core protein isoforms 1/2/3/4/5-like [Amphibalanus amphitrite]XP_043192506.1 broad-complex core protein isoforms 1/2/3/4/5-like [Amphibalanus amphitrite]XP_043192508.1 broad-complex core protein isoforms 1/2/3/4/5-like [Amphibalanus amphitrite]